MTRKSSGKRKKAEKLELVFDEKARQDFLTGFHKRKQQRREAAAKKFDHRFKQEKNRIRNEKRQQRLAEQPGPTLLPDNQLLGEAAAAADAGVTHQLPTHTVSVTSIAQLQLLPTPATLVAEEEEAGVGADPAPAAGDGDGVPGMELRNSVQPPAAAAPAQRARARANILHTQHKKQEKRNQQKSRQLQKHKSRVRRHNMKRSHQRKRQSKGKTV